MILTWSGQTTSFSSKRALRDWRNESTVITAVASTNAASPGSSKSGAAITTGTATTPAITSVSQPPAIVRLRSGLRVAENRGLVVVLVCIGMMDSP